MDLALIEQTIGTLAGCITAAGGAFLWAKKKYYKDNQDINQGKVELKFLEGILVRMDAAYTSADKAWTERNSVMTELGGLRAENVFLKEHIKSLEARVSFMEKIILTSRAGKRSSDIQEEADPALYLTKE
jgi:hypothetical protein